MIRFFRHLICKTRFSKSAPAYSDRLQGLIMRHTVYSRSNKTASNEFLLLKKEISSPFTVISLCFQPASKELLLLSDKFIIKSILRSNGLMIRGKRLTDFLVHLFSHFFRNRPRFTSDANRQPNLIPWDQFNPLVSRFSFPRIYALFCSCLSIFQCRKQWWAQSITSFLTDTSGEILVMTDESGRSIDVETQYIAMHCEATRGVRDTCWEMPKDAPKIKREKLNLFQWFKEFKGMFTGGEINFQGKLNQRVKKGFRLLFFFEPLIQD